MTMKHSDRAFVLGYKQYDTGREYLAKMGDWRQNKDVEVELDGIGGVNIVVKADVHRSGMQDDDGVNQKNQLTSSLRHQLPMLRLRKSS